MELTIKIKDTAFKAAIAYRLQYLFDDFDEDIIKACGYDRKATAEALFKDPKFIAAVTRDLAESLTARGDLHDLVAETAYAPLAKMYKTMEKLQYKLAEEERKGREAKAEATAIEQAILVLTGAGYKVVEKVDKLPV